MLTHDHFEHLCAAAVTGQISRTEMSELQEHMDACADCRDFVGDVRQVVGPALLEHAGVRSAVKLPKGARERFIAHAHSEGIPLGRKGPSQVRGSRFRRGMVLFAVVTFIALLGVLLYLKFLAGDRHPPATTGKVIEQRIIPAENKEAQALREIASLQDKIRSLEAEVRASAARDATYQEALKASDNRKAEITSRLYDLETKDTDLNKRLQDREAQITMLRGNLDALTSLKEANEIAIQADESELRNLRESVEKLRTDLQNVQAQAAAAKDAKELIAARNLHVVDVNDVNENGKKQKPFGRVYYAEGKTLRFYAYDLADQRKLDTKVQFYVWGEKNGVTVKTLGILHSDSLADNRWRLDFEDASVLTQIDTVFVTVENEQKPAVRPRGKRILDAVLGDKPNHP